MSVAYERSALEHPASLFDHAQRLLVATPNGPLPNGGDPLPDRGTCARVPFRERKAALAALVNEFINTPALTPVDLHERCVSMAITGSDVVQVLVEPVPGPVPRLRETARWLVRHGTDRRAVLVGLGLFLNNAEYHDIMLIKTIGLLRFADQLAIQVLARIPDAAHDMIWLADRSPGHARIAAVRALVADSDPDVRDWVLSTPRSLLSSDLARTITETSQISRTLIEGSVPDRLWDQAGNLLLAMSSTRNYHYEIHRYEQARAVYQAWVDSAADRPATLERAALLTAVRQDITSEPSATVIGEDRSNLAETIRVLLSSPPWQEVVDRGTRSDDPVEARRARWVNAETTRHEEPARRFAIRVIVPDPEPDGFPEVEARILIDGIPIVAARFDKGPAEMPEQLLATGRLRATDEPREVRLAEAYCTEGCCGGLYVTIVREGAEVVWKDWRSSMWLLRSEPSPVFRLESGPGH